MGGAAFPLITSCNEPFGQVTVEFGYKGALGRLGGLGLMSGQVGASSCAGFYMFVDDILTVVSCRVYFDAACVISAQKDDRANLEPTPKER